VDLGGFFSAVGQQWFLLVGGGVLTVMAELARRVRRPDAGRVDPSILWPAILAVFIACMVAWDQEHAGRVKAEKDLADVTQPKFTLLPEGSMLRTTPEGVDLYIEVRVISAGADSILDGYTLKLVTAKGGWGRFKAHNLIPVDVPGGVFAKLGIDRSNALHDKTALTPLKRGSVARGWLRFPIQGERPEELGRRGGRWVITAYDYLGRQYRTPRARFNGSLVPLEDTDASRMEFVCPGLRGPDGAGLPP
jgi:hypothetical protein